MHPVPLSPEKAHRSDNLRRTLLVCSIAAVLGSVAGLISVAAGQQQEDDTLGPSPLPRRLLVLALCGVLNAGFTTGVWGWKRWGIYGVTVVSLFAFMENWRVGGPAIAAPGLIGPVVLAIVAGISWGEFD